MRFCSAGAYSDQQEKLLGQRFLGITLLQQFHDLLRSWVQYNFGSNYHLPQTEPGM